MLSSARKDQDGAKVAGEKIQTGKEWGREMNVAGREKSAAVTWGKGKKEETRLDLKVIRTTDSWRERIKRSCCRSRGFQIHDAWVDGEGAARGPGLGVTAERAKWLW